jgi:exopolysaccharide production protein ExoZ
MRIIASIQYLRGLAAATVVLHHICARYELPLRGGAAGVDVFFIISGFIMWLVARQAKPSAGSFVKDRLTRIVPLYWLVTLALAALAALRPNLFPLDHPSFSHVVKSLLFLPHRAPHSSQPFPLLMQGWTLNYEMFFYGLFALALAAPRSDRPWTLTAMLVACVGAGAFVGEGSTALSTYTSPLLLEFLSGIWLASAWERRGWIPAWLGWALLCAGLLAFVAVELAGADTTGPLRIIYWGLPAFLLVSGAITVDRHGSLAHSSMLQVLGNASYSIYLTHALVITAVSVAAVKAAVLPGVLLYAVTLSTALCGGVICFAWIEKPLTRFVRQGHCQVTGVVLPAGDARAAEASGGEGNGGAPI